MLLVTQCTIGRGILINITTLMLTAPVLLITVFFGKKRLIICYVTHNIKIVELAILSFNTFSKLQWMTLLASLKQLLFRTRWPIFRHRHHVSIDELHRYVLAFVIRIRQRLDELVGVEGRNNRILYFCVN